MQLTTTRSAAADQGLKLLVFGPAGAGKTMLAASTGDPEHTLIISAEAGLLSIRDHDIDVIQISTMDDLRQAYAFAKGVDYWIDEDRVEHAQPAAPKTYTWVCLDSISEIAEVCLEDEMTKTANALKAYGEMGKTMARLIRMFRDLPAVNVYMSAKQERTQNDDGLIFAPMFPGKKISQGIAYWFDEVFALRTKKADDGQIQRFLQTVNDGQYECKDRSGSLKPFEQCNLQHISDTITSAHAPPPAKTKPSTPAAQ